MPHGALIAAFFMAADYETLVVAKRPDEASRVEARDIAAIPVRTGEDALRLVPGVWLVQHGNEGKAQQYYIRGFDAAHGSDFAVSVEGMPFNEWSNVHGAGYLDLAFLIPETIRQVDVTKGALAPGPGAFAIAGSADYKLGVAARGLRLGFGVGSTARLRGFATYSPSTSDFAAAEIVRDGGFGENRTLERVSVLAQKRFERWTWLAGIAFSRFDLPGVVRDGDPLLGSYQKGEGRSGRVFAQVSNEHVRFYAGFRGLALRENYTGYLMSPDGDTRAQRITTLSLGARGGHTWRLHRTLRLRGQAGVHADVLERGENEEKDVSGLQTLSHALAVLDFDPLPALSFEGGARVDVAQTRTVQLAVSPKLRVRFEPSANFNVTTSYGRGFRPQDLTSPAPMTLSDSVEVATRFAPSRYLGVSVAGFATFIDREVIFDHVAGTTIELSGTRRVGGEIVVFSSPIEGLTLQGDVTLVDARFSASNNPVPNAPWLSGGVRAVLTHGSGARAGLRFFAMAPRALPFGATSTAYTSVDATLGWHTPRAQLDLALENLLFTPQREGQYNFASDWRTAPRSALPVLHVVPGPPFNLRVTLSSQF